MRLSITPPSTIRIVIADDHALFREGLRKLLALNECFDVIAEVGDASSAIEATRALRPDLLLLDLAMPDQSGLDVLRQLSNDGLPTRTIMLTAVIKRVETLQAVQLGARGVVLKTDASNVLFESIQAVTAGQYWLRSERLADQDEALRKALNASGKTA